MSLLAPIYSSVSLFLKRLTADRALKLDNLSYLDIAISSRATDAGANVSVWAANTRGTKVDTMSVKVDTMSTAVSANLNSTITSRAPASSALSNTIWTDAKAGYLDNTINSRATDAGTTTAVWASNTRGTKLDTISTAVSANLNSTITSRAPASSALSNTIWTDAKAGYLDINVGSRATTIGCFVCNYTRTFTVPPNVYNITVRVIGGGGNGSSGGGGAGGAGGGGGGYAQKVFSVTPGTNYTVTVGGAGSTSSFPGSVTISATGGGNASGTTAGSGGIGSNGDINSNGGSGGSGVITSNGGGAGGGASGCVYGNGGVGSLPNGQNGGAGGAVTGGNTQVPSLFPFDHNVGTHTTTGGGGSGGGYNVSGYGGGYGGGGGGGSEVSNNSGGAGGQGLVVITW